MLKLFYKDPWIVVRSGTQTNCGGFAIVWGQAEYIEGERGVQIDWLDLGLEDDAKGVGFISGAVLREPFRTALQEGAELQYEKLALPKRMRVEVAKVFHHVIDGNEFAFRRAGWGLVKAFL